MVIICTNCFLVSRNLFQILNYLNGRRWASPWSLIALLQSSCGVLSLRPPWQPRRLPWQWNSCNSFSTSHAAGVDETVKLGTSAWTSQSSSCSATLRKGCSNSRRNIRQSGLLQKYLSLILALASAGLAILHCQFVPKPPWPRRAGCLCMALLSLPRRACGHG